MPKILVQIILNLLISAPAFAQNFTDFPGMIPLHFQRPPATDLVYNGRKISRNEAKALHDKGVDLSTLDPSADSDLWQNSKVSIYKPSEDDLGVSDSGEEFEYIGTVASVIGKNFRILVQKKDENGIYHKFIIMFSKRVHDVLLRKGVMRKLGYNIERIRHLKKFRVQFNGPASRNLFITGPDGLVQNTSGDAERWVTNLKDEDSTFVDLQDAIIMSSEINIYNLAVGPLLPEHIQDRRILNALSIVYGLTDVPESVNIFSWYPGRLVNGSYYLPFDNAESFSTPYEDARWIVNRLLKLSRQDFAEVVTQGDYPPDVAALLLEKLISRRNELRQVFALAGTDIEINPNISLGENLINGKLTKLTWDGYGSRFAWGEVESPLSGTEIKSLFKSKLISSGILSLVDLVNTELMPKTDIEKKFFEHQKDVAFDNFKYFLKNQKVRKTPFGFWATDAYNAKIIASREVVVGSYLGTDNLAQLADNVGISVDAGLVIGTDGLPANWFVGGQAKVYFTRVYSHLRPIKSVKASLSEPYRNIFVPLLNKNGADILNQILDESVNGLPPEELQKKATEVMQKFKEHLNVGESLIISDNIGGNLGLTAGYSMAERVSAQVQFNDQLFVLNRIHIHRKSDDTIQIYKDLGQANSVQLAFVLKARIQALEISVKHTDGRAVVKFYSLNIASDLADNPSLLDSVAALRQVLINNSFERLDSFQPPFVLSHKIKETINQFSILFFEWLGLKSRSEMHVVAPDGSSKDFVKVSMGKRSGRDYQSFGVDVLSNILDELTDQNIVIANTTSGNPGDTLWGQSESRRLDFESELSSTNKTFVEPFMNISYSWKGWQISQAGAQKILDDINKRFGIGFYPDLSLKSTERLQLYTISATIFIYGLGIDSVAHLSKKDLLELFNQYGHFSSVGSPCPKCAGQHLSAEQVKMKALNAFLDYQKNYLQYQGQSKTTQAAAMGLKMVSLLEAALSIDGLVRAVGGEDNIYIQSKIQGFRDGDENAYNPLFSNTKGRFGSTNWSGPLRYLQSQLDMTESEFYVYWLLRKID